MQISERAQALASESAGWAKGLGALLLAGLRKREGDSAGALGLLEQAQEAAAQGGLALVKAAARWARGKIGGGDEGRALVDSAEQWMAAQGAVAPGKLLEMLAPGNT